MTLNKLPWLTLAWLAATLAPAQAPVPHIDKIVAPHPQADAPVTIFGTNFGASGVLWIGGAPVVTSTWTDRVIDGVIPADTAGGAVWVERKDDPPGDAPWQQPTFVSSDGMQSILIPAPPGPDSGIVVHDVAVYDNLLLQQLLDSDRAKLASLQFLDQSKISANIGALQGASMQQSAFSLSVAGPPLPGVSTVQNSGSTSTQQTQGTTRQSTAASVTITTTTGASGAPPTSQLQVTGPTSSNSTSTNNQTNVTGPSTQTTYTLAAPTAPTPVSPPVNYFSGPSSFSPSASSILNEQMQLNSEVAGLALMLSGPLSDRIYPIPTPSGQPLFIQKHHITLGIPLTLLPSQEDKDAVAEVVVTVIPDSDAARDGAPSITAILPQSKTYNTANITSHSANLGGGVVTGVLTAGVNFLWQKQTYYIVQAQDTVAFQLPADPAHPDRVSFGWDLRPVLGNPTVTSGNRTLFVQLSFTPDVNHIASQDGISNWGSVQVVTRWKKVDKKTNIILPDAFDESTSRFFSIRDIVSKAQISGIFDPVDNGDGNLAVQVQANYYANSTSIKIGSFSIPQGAANATFLPYEIDFTAPALSLATQKASLLDGTGITTPLQVPKVKNLRSFNHCLTLSNPAAVEETATTAKITATLTLSHAANDPCIVALVTSSNPNPKLTDLPLTAVIGSKVFGFRDAPFDLVMNPADPAIPAGMKSVYQGTITLHAPIDAVRAARSLTIERLFWGDSFKDKTTLNLIPLPAIDKATPVRKNKDNLQIALNGSNLLGLQDPPRQDGIGLAFGRDGKKCDQPLPGYPDSDTARMLCVPGALLPTLSQAALGTTSGDILLVALPTPDKPKPTPTAGPKLQPHPPIPEGAAIDLTIKGTKLDTFDHVEIDKARVPADLSPKPKKDSIVVHLAAAMVKSPKIVLVFFFKGSPNISYPVMVSKKG